MSLTGTHTDIVARFSRLLKSGRVAHAYLFTGPTGAGKTQTALSVAQLVNCEQAGEAPCGACASCRKIAAGNHPDIYVMAVLKDENSILIAQARGMIQRAALKAYEAKVKVFIIQGVEQMTREAANSLLKTLEEPPANTLMILTTAVPEACLDTIRSRCHVVPFFQAPLNRVASALQEDGASAEEAAFLAFYADGCLGRARQMAKDKIAEKKNRWVDEFLSKGGNEEFLKELSSDKEDALQALSVLFTLVRDAVLVKSGVSPRACAHQDRLQDIRLLANRPLQELAAITGQIVRTRKLIEENLNAKMSLSLLKERII